MVDPKVLMMVSMGSIAVGGLTLYIELLFGTGVLQALCGSFFCFLAPWLYLFWIADR